ncbi:hypothetical protein Bbelb_152500 [Branchiostoma belcheri]|nr:hypothetical protein Bbelb_152500 [Branchiostoma belcheri]
MLTWELDGTVLDMRLVLMTLGLGQWDSGRENRGILGANLDILETNSRRKAYNSRIFISPGGLISRLTVWRSSSLPAPATTASRSLVEATFIIIAASRSLSSFPDSRRKAYNSRIFTSPGGLISRLTVLEGQVLVLPPSQVQGLYRISHRLVAFPIPPPDLRERPGVAKSLSCHIRIYKKV